MTGGQDDYSDDATYSDEEPSKPKAHCNVDYATLVNDC